MIIAKKYMTVASLTWNIFSNILNVFFFFSDPKTEQKNNSEREGYVYDFYYPSDNYGRLGKMWVLNFVKGWCGDSLPWFKLKFLKQRKALNYIDCKQADNVHTATR